LKKLAFGTERLRQMTGAETEYAELAKLHRLDAENWANREGGMKTQRVYFHERTANAISALLSDNARLKDAGQEALQQLDWLTASPEFGKLLRAALYGEPE
jgi:hypothetical protein